MEKNNKTTPKKTKSTDSVKEVVIGATETKTNINKRLPNMPNIVTKDTNSLEVTIDKSVFDDALEHRNENDEIREMKVRSTSHSVTIDESMLPKTTKKNKKVKAVTDLSTAVRIYPDYSVGLKAEEVKERKEGGYVNEVKKKSAKTYRGIFLSNIFTFFNLLTFVVAAALIAVHAAASQLFFLVIIFANICIGIFQEIKSKRAVDKLSLITAPSALVIRDGEKTAIPINELVLDDIIFLEMGKQICSDAVVVKGDIEVNESMLTGESVPVRKSIGDGLYSGSFVSSGNCYARVDKVGASNYVETLTSYAKKYKKPKSELHNSIRLIIKIVTFMLIPLTVVSLFVNYQALNGDWKLIISGVSGSVIGMIPAGMFLLTSMALAVSVIRLAKKKTLVQDLYCIEMLARVDVLCLDKTGTITDGSMSVNNVIEIKGGETLYTLPEIIGSMLTATQDNNQTALAMAGKFGYSTALKPISVLPFSSQRKLSAVTFEGVGTYMLGAPEFVLKDIGVRIDKIIDENASNGYRVMVLAHSPAEIVGDKLPAVRRPLCLIVIEDHIREDAVETIKWFKENNVAVKVISGDNPITVSEVARRVGVENAELYVSLDGLSNQEVIEAANRYTVFGRVTPEQKSLLVKSIKAKGHTVAMTGDGVNDILAMREADCSIAIASGSEAARNVSHLVLLDSNFTSMPDVVKEGRRVVNNIQKSSSLFLMKTLMSIVLTVVFLIMKKPYPFNTSNLLLLELLVIGCPSFVLAMQPNTNIIKGKFLSNVIGRCVPGGITLVLATMAVYFYNSDLLLVSATSETYVSMLVIALTFTGIMVLVKICEPFDAFRTVLVVGVVCFAFIMIIFLPSMVGIAKDSLSVQDLFYLTTVILGSYFFDSTLMKIMKTAKILN